MASISKAVVDNKADLGIIFDTDVDRAALVGKDGSFINKNALIAVISEILLEENTITTIVTDSITSVGLTELRIGINKEDFRPYAEQILSELSVFVEESENWSLV